MASSAQPTRAQPDPRSPRTSPRNLRHRRLVSFPTSPSIAPATQPRWTSALEEELVQAQSKLDWHQKQWSAEQEVWLLEVERLEELKEQAEKFERRRVKDLRKEGSRWRRSLSMGEAEVDDGQGENAFGNLLRRASSALTSDEDTPGGERSVRHRRPVSHGEDMAAANKIDRRSTTQTPLGKLLSRTKSLPKSIDSETKKGRFKRFFARKGSKIES